MRVVEERIIRKHQQVIKTLATLAASSSIVRRSVAECSTWYTSVVLMYSTIFVSSTYHQYILDQGPAVLRYSYYQGMNLLIPGI